MLTLALAIGFALCTFLLASLSLRQAMRWVKAEKPTFLRSLGLAVVLWFISTLCVGFSFGLPGVLPADAPFLWVSLGLILAQVVVDCVVIRWIVQVSFGKAILVWFGWLAAGAVSVAFAFFVGKTYLVEAFIIPTNNMAPTVVGWHEVGTCPHCAGTLTIPAGPPGDERYGHHGSMGICEKCLKTSDHLERRPPYQLFAGDRIMCNKLLGPRRWEVIIYRLPKDPKVKYLMRLVGLPGETVVIKEGAVWIDGVKQTPPAEIATLEYTSAEFAGPTEFATEANPLKLSAGECFVLGDFPRASADSRYDGPVPWENIEGVLGLRYYPLGRWKLWR
jgi:signal peptidase I